MNSIVFHIGSSSVGAGLLNLDSGESSNIIYSLREPIPFRASVSADRFVVDMLEALKTVNARIAKEGPQNFMPKHIYYVLASPWVVTQNRIIEIKEEKPFTITEARINKAIATKEKTAPGLELFEKRVIDIRLNGYQIENPYGKKARTAEISLFMSFIPKNILDAILDVSAKTYHPKDTKFSSFALASFLATRDTFHSEEDFIFLDIGGELSDFTIVKEGIIKETASFPLGRHLLIRKIQTDLEVSAEEAISLVRVYEEGVADKKVVDGIKEALDSVAEEWIRGFGSALAKVSNGMILPNKVFLSTHHDFVEFFVRTLSSERMSKFGVSEAPLVVTLLDSTALKSSITFAESITKDSFIAISAITAKKLYESSSR